MKILLALFILLSGAYVYASAPKKENYGPRMVVLDSEAKKIASKKKAGDFKIQSVSTVPKTTQIVSKRIAPPDAKKPEKSTWVDSIHAKFNKSQKAHNTKVMSKYLKPVEKKTALASIHDDPAQKAFSEAVSDTLNLAFGGDDKPRPRKLPQVQDWDEISGTQMLKDTVENKRAENRTNLVD